MKHRVLQFAWIFAVQILFHTVTNAQDHSTSTDWLELKFGVEDAQTMIDAGGEKLDLYLFIAANGVEVHNVAPKDISDYPDALELIPVHPDVEPLTEALLLEGTFNAELYNFERSNSAPSYYRVGETGHLIIVAPYEQLRTKFYNQQ